MRKDQIPDDMPVLYGSESAAKERPSKNLHAHRWINEELEFSNAQWTGLVAVCVVIGLLIGAILLKLIP